MPTQDLQVDYNNRQRGLKYVGSRGIFLSKFVGVYLHVISFKMIFFPFLTKYKHEIQREILFQVLIKAHRKHET